MLIKYYSNNSGGGDWLSKQDWDALEKNGWRLASPETFVVVDYDDVLDAEGLPQVSKRPEEPCYAYKIFNSLEDGIDEWHRIVGQDPNEEGCPCCGQPHEFSAE